MYSGSNRFLYAVAPGSTTDYSTFVGRSAGTLSPGGGREVGVGYQALNVSTGESNVAVGFNALAVLTNGFFNIGIGSFAGSALTGANSNIVIGYSAASVLTGSGNLVIGSQTATALTTGNTNILLGNSVATALTTGSNNIALGYNIQLPSNTASNQLDIGNLIYGTGIDGTGTTLSSGKIGIGTTTPNSLLNIAGTTPKLTLTDTSAGTNLKHWYLQSTGGALRVSTTSDVFVDQTAPPAFTINAGGNVGIGTANPGGALVVVQPRTETAFSSHGQVFTVSNNQPADTEGLMGGIAFNITNGIANSNAAIALVNTGARADLTFAGTNAAGTATEYMRIQQGGNVGIGTTTPFGRLSVTGAGMGTGSAFVVADSADVQRFTVFDNGKVSIGTTTPAAALTLSGLGHNHSVS